MNARRKTNTQFIKHLMDFSNNGALMQAFVLTAIEKYSDAVAKADPDELNNGFISGNAWIACAKEARTALDTHLSNAVRELIHGPERAK